MPKVDPAFLAKHEKTIDWLLNPNNPSVRFKTLTDLLGCSRKDSEVLEAENAIQISKRIARVFRHQQPDGSWQGGKWHLWSQKGTAYTLLLLGELGALPDDKIAKAFDYIHEKHQLSSGLIDYKPVKTQRRRESQTTSGWCLTAIVLRAALLLGYRRHPLVRQSLTFLENYHQKKGGWFCNVYSADPLKVRPRNCYMGTIKALNAYSLLSPRARSDKIQKIIDKEIAIALKNQVYLYRVNPKGQPAEKRAWKKFAFPRFWKSDALEATDALTRFGIHDERLSSALTLIKEKQLKNGRWHLDVSPTKRAWIQLEREGKTSKWVTLRALRVLKHVYEK